jgi:hypothetical protein
MVQYVDDVDHLMANQLTAFFHCAQCLAACPPDMSAAEFARLAVGRTPYGLQVWCVRHNLNVYHLDLTSATRPRCVTHGVETDVPFHDDLKLGCHRCGFNPGNDA